VVEEIYMSEVIRVPQGDEYVDSLFSLNEQHPTLLPPRTLGAKGDGSLPIAGGLLGHLALIGSLFSDRALKRDITTVSWTRSP
jgi:hypothetical protein